MFIVISKLNYLRPQSLSRKKRKRQGKDMKWLISDSTADITRHPLTKRDFKSQIQVLNTFLLFFFYQNKWSGDNSRRVRKVQSTSGTLQRKRNKEKEAKEGDSRSLKRSGSSVVTGLTGITRRIFVDTKKSSKPDIFFRCFVFFPHKKW